MPRPGRLRGLAAAAAAATAVLGIVPVAHASGSAGHSWRLVQLDNFTGSGLGSGWGLYNQGIRRASLDRVSGGLLNETATYFSSAHRWYVGGVSDGLNFRYGEVQARVRFSQGFGIHAVAMLWPATGWHPGQCDEIDFFETGNPATVNTETVHYGNNRMIHSKQAGNYTNWHTVGLIWQPGVVTYTLDGRVVDVIRSSHVPAVPMHLALQQGIYGSTLPSLGRTPAQVPYQIDWIAIYQ